MKQQMLEKEIKQLQEENLQLRRFIMAKPYGVIRPMSDDERQASQQRELANS